MKRDAYKKLMNLQSAAADALLADKLKQVDDMVRSATDNDSIYQQLEVLEQFIYKVSGDAMNLLKFILTMEPLPPKEYATKYGPYTGKEYGDIVKKVMELLNRIRYYQTDEILPIYYEGFKEGVRKPLEDKIRDMAQYNLDALRHIGYRPQLAILDFLEKHKSSDKTYVDFLIEVSQHIASNEGESHGWKDENTLVFGYGPLPYTKELEHIRDWLIQEAGRLIKDNRVDLERKLRLIELLRKLTDAPHGGTPRQELSSLIARNIRAILKLFEDVLPFDGGLKAPLPLALEIEEQLIFISRDVSEESLLQEIDALIDKLHEDYAYKIYRELVGDRLDYFSRKNSTYEEARAANEAERKKLLEGLDSIEHPLTAVLEKIATYRSELEAWKLHSYGGFLNELAKDKPKLAYQILEKAASTNSPMAEFAGDFLIGFKRCGATEEFDKTVAIVVKGKRREAVRLLCIALTLNEELSDADVALATEILRREKRFAFLDKSDWFSYDNFLAEIFARMLKRGDEVYDDLFIELLQLHDDPSRFEIGAIRRELDTSILSEKVRNKLLQVLVEVEDLSYEYQELLLQLEGAEARNILKFFMKRVQLKQSSHKRAREENYEPVPYHLNKDLIKAIRDDEEYTDIVKEAVATFTEKWSVYNSELSRLFRRTGHYKDALIEFVRGANKQELKKVLNFCDAFEPIDLDVAVEVAKKTTDKKIRSSIRSRMYNTGVVSGEYGLANEHQRKLDYLKEKYGNDKNPKLQSFIKETLEWLDGLVKDERQRTKEELRLRKVEFER